MDAYIHAKCMDTFVECKVTLIYFLAVYLIGRVGPAVCTLDCPRQVTYKM